jgi:hypothetical protein
MIVKCGSTSVTIYRNTPKKGYPSFLVRYFRGTTEVRVTRAGFEEAYKEAESAARTLESPMSCYNRNAPRANLPHTRPMRRICAQAGDSSRAARLLKMVKTGRRSWATPFQRGARHFKNPFIISG